MTLVWAGVAHNYVLKCIVDSTGSDVICKEYTTAN